MNYTTIEQSKKLLELGLSPESADMNWYQLPEDPLGRRPWIARTQPYKNRIRIKGDLPCWSIGGLLEVIPKDCIWYLQEEKSFYIEIKKEIYWTGVQKNYIDACYNMVVWLLENNYIKKGE